MVFLATHVAVLVAVILVAFALGLPWARRLGCGGIAERLAWGSCLGLLAAAQILHLLALASWLRPGVVLLALAVALVFGAREMLSAGRDLWDLLRHTYRGAPRRALVGAIGAAVLLLPGLAWALYPPHAWDETIYHLVFARAFAASGSLPFLEQLRGPVFPPFSELLDAALLLFADDTATHWISWLAAAETAGILVVWSGREARPQQVAAAALYLGAPMVVYLAGVAYVDTLLCLWVTAAIAAWQRAHASGERRWLLASGACAGSAAGVKYLGVFFVGWLAFEVLSRWRCPAGASLAERVILRARATVWWGGAAAAACGLVYVRIFALTGNPMFPFYPGVFGSSPWLYEPVGQAPGLATRLFDLLALPWRSVFDRAAVGAMPPYSPFWLIALVAALVGLWRSPRWRWPLAMSFVYLLVTPPNARYLLPVVPVVGLAGLDGIALGGAGRRSSLRTWRAVALVLVLPGATYAVTLLARRGPLPLDVAGRETFLARNLECYRAVSFLNRTLGERYTAYGMQLERLAGLARGRWLGDHSGPTAFGRVERLRAAPTLLARDLRSMGVDVLVATHENAFTRAELAAAGLRRIYDDERCTVWAFDAAPAR